MLIQSPSHYCPAKIAQYLKGKSSYQLQREFSELGKKYWGQHLYLWGRGYFCSTVGAVTEEQITCAECFDKLSIPPIEVCAGVTLTQT